MELRCFPKHGLRIIILLKLICWQFQDGIMIVKSVIKHRLVWNFMMYIMVTRSSGKKIHLLLFHYLISIWYGTDCIENTASDYYCVCIRCRGKVFIVPFPDNGHLFWLYCPCLQALGVTHSKTARWYCGVAPSGRSIERPLLINGYAYLAVSLPDNGRVDSNS
jgi:hypothetical protein